MLVRWAFYTIGIPNLISFVLATGLGVLLSGFMPASWRGLLLAVVDYLSRAQVTMLTKVMTTL